MPISDAVRRLSLDPHFWRDLLTDDEPHGCAGSGELRVSFPLTGGYGLVLDLDLERREQALGLRMPASSEPIQLGWATPGQPYPAVLHFGELDLFARAIALDDPLLPHPGLVVALLSRFAPLGPADDPATAQQVLAAAYRSLRRDVPARPDSGPDTGAATGPQQAPLPLFTDDRWWPRPAVPSGQVLDEAAVAEFSVPAAAGHPVRDHARFPADGFAELVRRARTVFDALPREPWYDHTRVRPLARRIAAGADLRHLPDLLGALTEAGCDHPTVLDALSEPLVAVQACWMVEALAALPPGSMLRRHLAGAPV